MENKQLA